MSKFILILGFIASLCIGLAFASPEPAWVPDPALVIRNDLKSGSSLLRPSMLRLLLNPQTRDLVGMWLESPWTRMTLAPVTDRKLFMSQISGLATTAEKKGHVTVKMDLSQLNGRTGGMIEVYYATNALFGKFSTFNISVERVGDHWMIFSDPGHAEINTLFFYTQSLGIKSVSSWKDQGLLPN